MLALNSEYGKWTILDGPFGQYKEYKCRCTCGLVKNVREQHLVSKSSTGCSSCRGEFGSRFSHLPKPLLIKLTHIVDHAIERCTNKTDRRYGDYGGRGIRVLFPNRTSFLEHLLTLPGHDDKSLIIDRINNSGHYEVGNLRFVTHSASIINRRRNEWNEVEYYIRTGFVDAFRRLRRSGISIRKIGELYCTSYGTILRCTRRVEG